MGAIRFSIDPGLVQQLQPVLPLKVFVETGTYEGDSVQAVRPLFEQLHTIELSPQLYARAAERFQDDANVHVHHGASQDALPALARKLRRRSVLYWLDAHWSAEEHAEGGEGPCPLLEELEAIGSLGERSVVLIDDARLFLAPPPMPAKAEGWPEFSEVLKRLSALNSQHEVLVIDDVIVFFPPRARDVLRDYARHHAVDWLVELQASRRIAGQLDRLRSQVAGFQAQVVEHQDARATELGKKITDSAATLEALENEVRKLGVQTRQSRRALDEIPAAMGEIPTALEEIRSLERRIDPLTAQLESLGQGVSALREDSRESLDQRIDPLTAQLESLGALVEGLRSEVKGIGAELKEVETQSQASREVLDQLPEARKEIASLGQRVDEFKNDVDQLNPKVEEGLRLQSRRSTEAIEHLRALRRQIQSLEGRLDETSERRGPIKAIQYRLASRRERGLRRPSSPRRAFLRSRRFVILGWRRTRRGVKRVGRFLAGPRYWERMSLQGARLGDSAWRRPRELRVPRRYRRPIKLEHPPTISVVTPSDDEAPFLDRTIQSVLEQGYERLEYIVEADNATNETAEVLERHRERLAHYDVRRNGGPGSALNIGFDHATGEILSYVRSDALLLPGTLPYVARYFERHPEVDVVYGHRILIDDEGNEIGRWVLPRHDDDVLTWADYIPQEALFWRRNVWEAVGGEVDEGLRDAVDWELALRFRRVGARMARVPRFLAAHRVRDPGRRASGRGAASGNHEMQRLLEQVHGRKVSNEEIQRAIRPYIRRHVVLQKLYRLHLLRY